MAGFAARRRLSCTGRLNACGPELQATRVHRPQRSMEIDMPSRSSVRTLASAIAAAFVTAFAPPPSLAQTAPSSQYQVLEFDYAPATPTPGLDLRPGRYLLQLRRDPSGNYEGLLRGPRNEIVAERLQFSASSGCSTNPPANAVLSTRALPAQRGLNVLHLEVIEGTGSCTLYGELPNLGFTLPEKPPQWLECEQPTEIEETGARDPGPVCNVEEWEPPLAAPRPDLEPGPVIVFGESRRVGAMASEFTRAMHMHGCRGVACSSTRTRLAIRGAQSQPTRMRVCCWSIALASNSMWCRCLPCRSQACSVCEGALRCLRGRGGYSRMRMRALS